ncbi:MAG: MFS transporter, partial [Candidatus Binataceae bacterium]
LNHDAHMPGSQIGILLAFGALIGSVAALLAESAVSVCGSRRRALIIAVALAILGITITPLMPNFALLAVAMVVFGVGMGINQPLLLAILSSAVSYENQGVSAGLRSTANLIASLLIPIVMGFVIEAAGIRHGFYIMGAALLFACLIVFSLTHDVEAPHEIDERAAGR